MAGQSEFYLGGRHVTRPLSSQPKLATSHSVHDLVEGVLMGYAIITFTCGSRRLS